MSTSWLEPLLEPAGLIRDALRGEMHEKPAVALLLDGRLSDYARRTAEPGLPPLGAWPDDATRTPSLLTALAAHLSGYPGAVDLYERIVASAKTSDLATAAAVLGSVALADSGDQERALALLNMSLERAADIERVLLLIHVGVRSAELASWESALESTEQAVHLSRQTNGPTAWREALRLVGRSNRLHFRQLSGRPFLDSRLPNRSRSRLLARVDGLVTDGLSSYLRDQFDTQFTDPRSVSLRFGTQDSIEARLYGALLRAECLGDWQMQRELRRLAGRYRLLTAAGRSDRQPEAGFHMLRRGSDARGLERAARIYRQLGPLEPLRRLGEGVAASNWVALEQRANLVILRDLADVLLPESATLATHRLLSGFDTLTEPGRAEAKTDLVIETLCSLAPVASDESQDLVANLLLKVAEEESDPLLLQTMARRLNRLRWPVVSRETRRKWLSYLSNHIGRQDDRSFVADAAAGALAETDSEEVRLALSEAYRERPSYEVGARLISLGPPIDPSVARAIANESVSFLEQTRVNAAQGSYALSAGFDPAFLLAWLLIETSEVKDWSALETFLLDPRVASWAKAPTLSYLAERTQALPPKQQIALGREVIVLGGLSDDFARSADASAGLTLALALGSISQTEALTHLLALLSGGIGERAEAARLLKFAASLILPDILVTLALELTQDDHPVVRGAAGYSLAATYWKVSSALSHLVTTRLRHLLREPGSEVPRQVINGLAESIQGNLPVNPQVMEEVRFISESHLAASVRSIANELMDLNRRELRATEQ